MTSRTGTERILVPISLFLVYVVWGSTYLALRWGLEGFPPFVMNGIRLVVAGALLYPVARHRGRGHPTRLEWRNSAVIGTLMFIGGLGLVTVAEDNGVGSGLAASAVAVMPLWAALLSGLFGRWPRRLEWLGLTVGFVGVLFLSREGDFQGSALGTVLVLVAPLIWAFASIVSTRVRLPSGLMASAAQMLTGGVALFMAGFARGERIAEWPALKPWLALAYLIVFGSILAYTAYVYLLANTRAAVATSYAYVNPVVAVILGVTLGREVIGGWALVGLPIILLGVAIVGMAQRERRKAGPTPAGVGAGR